MLFTALKEMLAKGQVYGTMHTIYASFLYDFGE